MVAKHSGPAPTCLVAGFARNSVTVQNCLNPRLNPNARESGDASWQTSHSSAQGPMTRGLGTGSHTLHVHPLFV